jgi:hypothetical protein
MDITLALGGGIRGLAHNGGYSLAAFYPAQHSLEEHYDFSIAWRVPSTPNPVDNHLFAA